MTTILTHYIAWVPVKDGAWNEWQYSPVYDAYHFVGQVGTERVQYALDRMENGESVNY